MSLKRKATEMRNAIAMIEGSLFGAARIDWGRLSDIFESSHDGVVLNLKVTVGEFKQLYSALQECNRIVNSEEYFPANLSD